MKLQQKNVNTFNSKRHYHALSFRFRADGVLTSEAGAYPVEDHTVAFVPAGLDYRRVARVDELVVVHFELVNCDAKDIECFTPRDTERVARLFSDILACWERKEVGYAYQCSAMLYEILSLCYAENHKPSATDSKIQKSVEYLLAHYKDCRLSIKEIADRSFISEVYFRKLFKAQFGVSPQKYIVRLRLQYAKELISTGYYSLKEIALMAGYTDYKYFSTEFKRQVGVSPSDYFYNYGT